MMSTNQNPQLRNPLVRKAGKPFYFNTSEHLLRIGRQKAITLSDLLQALRTCPEDSIFQHTFRAFLELRRRGHPLRF